MLLPTNHGIEHLLQVLNVGLRGVLGSVAGSCTRVESAC